MCQRKVCAIIGIVVIIFTLLWCIFMLILPWISATKSYPNNENFPYNVDKKTVAFNIILYIVAISLGASSIVYGFSQISFWFPMGFIIGFIVIWIIYIAIFFTSDQYKLISKFDSPFEKVYSINDFNKLLDDYKKLNPIYKFRISSVKGLKFCQTALYNLQATSSINEDEQNVKLNLNDYLGAKKGLAIVDFTNIISWTPESEKKIIQFKNEILACPQLIDKKSDIQNFEGIDSFAAVSVRSYDSVPKKFQKKYVRLEGVFWAGARLGFDLSTISIIDFPITKTSASFDTNYPPKFNCSDLQISCWDLTKVQTCSIKEFKKENENIDINEIFPIKSDSNLFKKTLTRAFYLSDASYTDDFSQFVEEEDKKQTSYIWSKELIDEWFIKENRNGYLYPSFYIGRHEKEIWITIRGTHSVSDGATDLTGLPAFIDGTYHKGFFMAGQNIWPKLFDVIHKYEKDNNYVFIFTGHSYGGAIANILHRFTVYCFPNLKSRCFSFRLLNQKEQQQFYEDYLKRPPTNNDPEDDNYLYDLLNEMKKQINPKIEPRFYNEAIEMFPKLKRIPLYTDRHEIYQRLFDEWTKQHNEYIENGEKNKKKRKN